MRRFAVAVIMFFDNELKIKIVKAENWKDALKEAFPIEADFVIITGNDILETKRQAFDQDWMFEVIEVQT